MNTSTTNTSITSSTTYNDNNWYHVVWTIDSAGNWILYINGTVVPDFTSYASGTYPDNTSNYTDNYFFYNTTQTSANNIFQGALAEFKMYNIVLSPSQVTAIYNTSGTIPTTQHNYEIIYFPLNQNVINYAANGQQFDNRYVSQLVTNSNINLPLYIGPYYLYQPNSDNTSFPVIQNSVTLPSNGLSVSVWVYPIAQKYTSKNLAIFWTVSSTNVFALSVYSTASNFNFNLALGTTNTTTYTGSSNTNTNTSYTPNAWYHVVWTITTGGRSTFYINGINTSLGNNNLGYPPTSVTGINFFGASGNRAFMGGISEFRIYNIVLTSSQVTTLYNGGKGVIFPTL